MTLTVPRSLRLEDGVNAGLLEVAEKEGRSVNNAANLLIREALEHREEVGESIDASQLVVPICYEWSVPSEIPTDTLDQIILAVSWHDGHCAMCGAVKKLGMDHCHDTILCRGLICQSCNMREWRGYEPQVLAWRERNAFSMLGIELDYWKYTRLKKLVQS